MLTLSLFSHSRAAPKPGHGNHGYLREVAAMQAEKEAEVGHESLDSNDFAAVASQETSPQRPV